MTREMSYHSRSASSEEHHRLLYAPKCAYLHTITGLNESEYDEYRRTEGIIEIYQTMYKCEICHGRFSRPENMMRHKRNSHRSGDLHPYLCSCGRSYTRSDILLRHQRGCEVHNNGGTPLPGVTTANLKKRGRKPKAVHQPSHSAPPTVTDPSYLAGVAAAATQKQQQQQQQQGIALEDWGTVASFDSDPGLDSAYWNCPLYSNSSTPGTEFDAYPGIPLYENGNQSNQQIPQENTSSSDWNTFFQQHNQQQQQQTNESFSAWL